MNASIAIFFTLLGYALGQTYTVQTKLRKLPRCNENVMKCINKYWMNYTGPEPHFMDEVVKAKITHVVGATAGLLPDDVQCAYAENYKDRRIFIDVYKPYTKKPRRQLPMIVTECGRHMHFPIIGRYSHLLPPIGEVRAAYTCTNDGEIACKHFGVINVLSAFYLDTDYQTMKERLSSCGVEVQEYPYECPEQ